MHGLLTLESCRNLCANSIMKYAQNRWLLNLFILMHSLTQICSRLLIHIVFKNLLFYIGF